MTRQPNIDIIQHMNRAALLAAIEEDTDADLASLAARDPEEAADELEYRAKDHDDAATKAQSWNDASKERAMAENLRMHAANLRCLQDAAA